MDNPKESFCIGCQDRVHYEGWGRYCNTRHGENDSQDQMEDEEVIRELVVKEAAKRAEPKQNRTERAEPKKTALKFSAHSASVSQNGNGLERQASEKGTKKKRLM